MDNLVIFGASGGAVKVIKSLKTLGITVMYVTDNSKAKWGSFCEGIKIIPPDDLKEMDCKIIIASVYQEEIETQLKEIGIFDRIVLKEEYISSFFEKQSESLKEKLDKVPLGFNDKTTVLFDMMECSEYGGIEKWSYTVAEELLNNDCKVSMIGDKNILNVPECFINDFIQYDIDYGNYYASICHVMEVIKSKMPCSIIISRQGAALVAAVAIKKLYPEQVNIISVSHTDRIWLHRRVGYYKDIIDSAVCVSSRIAKRLIREFNLDKEKVHYMMSPVKCTNIGKLGAHKGDLQHECKHDYHTLEEPVNIAFASRITKAQKRADLIKELVLKLEDNRTNYILNIAGEGDYLPKLKEFIVENKLSDRIKIWGMLSENEMPGYWKEQDIYINTSEYEGTSLAMLEAMSYGVVPVVTKVSGADDVITNGENGFICEQHDIEAMAGYIEMLANDREKIKEIGKRANETICEKCDQKKYGRYIYDLCQIL